jgi:hypothetical protein
MLAPGASIPEQEMLVLAVRKDKTSLFGSPSHLRLHSFLPPATVIRLWYFFLAKVYFAMLSSVR